MYCRARIGKWRFQSVSERSCFPQSASRCLQQCWCFWICLRSASNCSSSNSRLQPNMSSLLSCHAYLATGQRILLRTGSASSGSRTGQQRRGVPLTARFRECLRGATCARRAQATFARQPCQSAVAAAIARALTCGSSALPCCDPPRCRNHYTVLMPEQRALHAQAEQHFLHARAWLQRRTWIHWRSSSRASLLPHLLLKQKVSIA